MSTKSEQQRNIMICEKHKTEMVESRNVFFDFNVKMFGIKPEDCSLPEYDYTCEQCEKEREEAEDIKEKIKSEKELHKKITSGIPIIYQQSQLSDFVGIDSIIDFLKSGKGFLFIKGTTGTGKTHLLCAIKRKFNELNKYSNLFFSSDIFLNIRKSFNGGNESEYDIVKSCTAGELTMFDDFGAQKASDFAIETWYNIINTRYMNNYPTIFTSNISLKEISIQLSDRIASRLASGMTFELSGSDRRLIKNK